MENVRLCSMCRSPKTKSRFSRHDGLTLWKCCDCQVEFLFPQPRSDKKTIYDLPYFDYYGTDKQREKSLFLVKEKTSIKYLQEIERFASRGKILDVGCAAGHFLDAAKKCGWNPYGLEIASMGKKAQSLLGARRVKLTSLKKGVFPDESFQAITFLDVLEHLTDPVESLHIARSLLKPGGVIVVVTPNTGSVSAKLMGKYWNHYHIDHLFSFNRNAIKTLFQKTGFRLIEVKPTMKYFNLAYIVGYFESYPTPILTRLARLLYRVSPRGVREMPVPFLSGSLFAIGQKSFDKI